MGTARCCQCWGSSRHQAGASSHAPSGPNLPACLPWQLLKTHSLQQPKNTGRNAHECCCCSLWRLEARARMYFLQTGRFCIQFPLMLSFAPLKTQGVLVAHVNNPAWLHEPALQSNGGWIGYWCYLWPPWLFSHILR